MRTDPTLASDIARQLAAAAPDALVTATFDLASRLRLGTEQRRLMQRIQLLGARGVAGVELITDIAVVLERMEQARKQADQNYESYCNGHIAVQMLANLNESVLAQQYLGNLLAPPDASRRPAPVHARYGRRYDEAIWPERREDVSVIMDLTALLTVHGLGLLDIVERAFGRILLAPDAINVLTHIRQKTTPLQPDRLEAARHLVELADQGALPDPATVSPIDTFRVVWEVADGEPESTLNLPALIAAMQAAWDAAQLADITDRLDETVKVAPVGPRPKAGATVILDAGIAVELHLAGALDAVRGHYTVCVTGEEIDQRRLEILQAERDERLAAALDTLIERIAAGAKDGTYEFVPFDPKVPAEPVSRQYFQCLRAMETQGSLFWVDDRFTTSVDTPAYPTVTTVEILEALGRYGRLDAGRITRARLRLRAAGWTFMPVDGPEIASLVLACVRGGEVSESEDLRTLRRSTAWSVLERRRLQSPSGEQADQGVRGEIPFLLDQGSAVVAALISIWSDKKVSNDDASAASSWVLEHLDMSGRPPTVIPAGDPRSDFLAGLHIGHLVALAMQVTPLRRNADRKKAYLEWLWGDVIGNRLRSCPEMLPTVLETIERLLLEDVLEDPDQQRVWNAFSFEVVDALPDELRNRLLDRPAMTAAYNVQRTGTMAAAGGEFDERAYLATIIALQPGKDSRLKTVDGRKAKFRLTRNGEESAVTVTIGRRSARVDDWPRRMSSDDAVVRRAALEEQAMALDMVPSERDALSDELAAISGAERPLKVVFLAGDTMSGWFGQLEGKLRARKPIGPAEILPDDIDPVFLRLQLDGTRSLVDAQARTIEAVGLYEAIRRWSGVPVAPSPAFFDAIAATSDDAIIELADRIAKGGTTWNKVFVARLLWARGVKNAALGQILGDALLDALTGERADGEWELLSACAQFLTGDLPQRPNWHDHPVADRLAMLWSHAGTLTQHFLAAGLTPTDLAEFLISNRLASPRLLVAEQTGFSGDVANPLDAFSRRLRIHAAAPLLAEMAKDGTKKETAMRAAFALLMHVVDDTPMFALRTSHGELTHQDALGSYLVEPACEHLEPLFDHEIPYLAPRIGPFLSEMVAGDDPITVRGAWIQLRSAMGRGRLPDALALPVRAAAAKAPIVTSPEAVISDLSVLLAVSAIAAANGWSDLADSIDDAFGRLLATGQSGDQITTLLFETAFNRAWLEEQSERRIEVLADRLEQLRARPDMMEEAVTAAARFADAMSGTLAQPFIDLIARARS